jgi:hypothetical protein
MILDLTTSFRPRESDTLMRYLRKQAQAMQLNFDRFT